MSEKHKMEVWHKEQTPVEVNRLREQEVPFTVSVHEFRETCHSVTYHFMKKDSKQCCDTTTPESIHTKDESKCGTVFAFIFGVN